MRTLLVLACMLLPAAALAGTLTPATGGGAISADTNIASGTATWTTLTGPVYSEAATGEASLGTVVFNAPSGFSFNTAATPVATVTRLGGGGSGNRNLAISFTSISSTQIVFTITRRSSSGVYNSITWSNIQVRPNSGTPLSNGNITLSGTAVLNGAPAGSNCGTLTEVGGAPTHLVFSQQPTNANGGATISPPVAVQLIDAYGNLSATSATVTMAIGSNPGGGVLSGTLAIPASAGTATFSDLSINAGGTGYTLVASSSGLPNATSDPFNIIGTGLVCNSDNFTDLAHWTVGNAGGTFGNPIAINNRLRLTDASTGVATYATFTKLYGNKIVVEFTDYAYGGTDPGADGIAVILSDASQSPAVGAFGGSLGYAPKQVALGGDTTHPGFAGGWIGVGIDEYGNYSNNTEGRTGGAAPGFTPEAVAIRGSGSGYTGYAYITGTGTLPIGIDRDFVTQQHLMTSGPGYRYRVTVDYSDSIHAWVSVERDTGSGYVYLISPFDAKAVTGQAPVPTEWYISLTGASGASTNIHEISSFTACSTSVQTVSLDHIELDHSGTACGADDVTVKACGNADCSVAYLGSVTANLTATPTGATWSANPVTFTGGQAQVTISGATGTTYTLGASASAPNPTVCVGGPSGSPCNLTFASSCFDAVEVGQNPSTPIYTKLSGTGFNLDVLAVSGGTVNTRYRGTVSVSLVNPAASSGNCADTNTGLTAPTSYTFVNADNGRRTFSFSYPNAARDVRVRVVSGTQPVCSSDDFAIRPQQFSLSTTTPLNPSSNNLASGANYNLTANSGISAGYDGTPVIDATKVSDHNGVAISTLGLLTGSFPAASGSISSGTFQYQDVGTILFNANAVHDPTFTQVDQVTGVVGGVNHGAGGDCVLNSPSNAASGGRYGCNIGSPALGPLGRFRPDHYEVIATLTPACNGFTYMGQPQLGINLAVSAASSTGSVLSRYTTGGNFSGLCSPNSCLATLAVTGDNAGAPVSLSGRLSPVLPAFSWANGQYLASGAAYSFARLSSPDGPYDSFALKTSVNDVDGVLITKLNGVPVSGSSSALSTSTMLRYGRMQIDNAYGSELLPLPVNVAAQYWNGSYYIPNTFDNCTSLSGSNFSLQAGGGASISTTIQGGGTLASGKGSIMLTKPNPTPSGVGSVDLSSTIPWLPGMGRETFGLYGSKFIYLREIY